jgi:hypothetical protein
MTDITTGTSTYLDKLRAEQPHITPETIAATKNIEDIFKYKVDEYRDVLTIFTEALDRGVVDGITNGDTITNFANRAEAGRNLAVIFDAFPGDLPTILDLVEREFYAAIESTIYNQEYLKVVSATRTAVIKAIADLA